jgi:hypothetical protein
MRCNQKLINGKTCSKHGYKEDLCHLHYFASFGIPFNSQRKRVEHTNLIIL